jgi:guanylate kinase
VKHFLLVLSSPSGGGKTTIAKKLVQDRDDVAFSVSATTRQMRPGEAAGREYHFLTEAEFDARIDRDEFLEHAKYGVHRYGTLLSEVRHIFKTGKHAVLDIEVEGTRQVRERFPDAVTVFVLPPTGAELVARLRDRKTESGDQVVARLERAQSELEAAAEYDYIVVNNDLAVAVNQVSAVIEAEGLRTNRRIDLEAVIRELQQGVTEAGAKAPTS